MIAISHGDTSTTMLQPLGRDRRALPQARRAALCRLHGFARRQPFRDRRLADRHGVRRLQKCLSGPPGSSPVTFNDRTAALITDRKHIEQGIKPPGTQDGDGALIRSNYFDLAMIMEYWSPKRLNHHTEAASMLYAARECARTVLEEGLERGIARHQLASRALRAGLEAMGLELFGDSQHRMANVTGVIIPESVHGRRKDSGRIAARFRHRDRHIVRAARRQDLAHRNHGLCLPQAQCAALPDGTRGGPAPQSCQAAGRSRGRRRLSGLRERVGCRACARGDYY